MPSRPEKSISVYREEDAQTYEEAITQLRDRGHLEGDESAGEELAVLAGEYLDESGRSTASKSSGTSVPWAELASYGIGIVGMLVCLGIVLLAAFYLGSLYVL